MKLIIFMINLINSNRAHGSLTSSLQKSHPPPSLSLSQWMCSSHSAFPYFPCLLLSDHRLSPVYLLGLLQCNQNLKSFDPTTLALPPTLSCPLFLLYSAWISQSILKFISSANMYYLVLCSVHGGTFATKITPLYSPINSSSLVYVNIFTWEDHS